MAGTSDQEGDGNAISLFLFSLLRNGLPCKAGQQNAGTGRAEEET